MDAQLKQAPFYSGGGYATEAVGFVDALLDHANASVDLQLSQHGDAYNRVSCFATRSCAYINQVCINYIYRSCATSARYRAQVI
jgi:hypothetical protein